MKKTWCIAGLLLVLDRLTKLWAQGTLQPLGVRAAWPGVFQFAYARNTGAAFSMLAGNNILLAIFNAVMLALVMACYFKVKSLSPLTRAGMILVVLGGLGNVIDRLAYGYVIDFIDLMFIRFAVFNVADIMVSTGALIAAIGLLVPVQKGDAAA